MQKLQNSIMRKILRSFRNAFIETLKIKSNISSIEIGIHRKMQKYALRIIKRTKDHSIRLRTSIFYFSKYQNEIFDENFIQWDKNEKNHASQINRILNTIKSHVNEINIENNEIWIKSWKKWNTDSNWKSIESKMYRLKIHQLKNHRIN